MRYIFGLVVRQKPVNVVIYKQNLVSNIGCVRSQIDPTDLPDVY